MKKNLLLIILSHFLICAVFPYAAPVVSINSPANSASLPVGNITITAAASEAGGTISKVEFYHDGTLLGIGTLSGSDYSYTWANVAAGTYALTALAYDGANLTTSSSTVTISVYGLSVNLSPHSIDLINPFDAALIRFTNGIEGGQIYIGSGRGSFSNSFAISQANIKAPSSPGVAFIRMGVNDSYFGRPEYIWGGHTITVYGTPFNSFSSSSYGGLALAGSLNSNGFGPKLDFLVGDKVTGASFTGGGILMTKNNLPDGDVTNVNTEMGFHLRQDASTIVEVMHLKSDRSVGFGNGLLLDKYTDGSTRVFGPGKIVYQSNGTVDQHIFSNDIGPSFTGTLVTVNPGMFPLQPGQLSLKVLGAQGIPGLAVTVAGNVGIGINNPSAKLAVNGDILAKKVKVTPAGWPDYVFENAYPLCPLTELQDYIEKNKHLPGVQSEKEVQQAGLDLGENQAALLKKIEELTLYVIGQHKEIEALKEMILSLKKKQVL